MSNPKRPRVAYLFGAGTTHAEIMDNEDISELFIDENSLLISDLSKRVLKKIEADKDLIEKLPFIRKSRREGNIELLISLVESNNIPDSELITKKFKDIVKEEIVDKIEYFSKKKTFYLHKALLEFHEKIRDKEELIGLITLNYDDILDKACEEILGKSPNYCLSSKGLLDDIPLLKLHGSFNWQIHVLKIAFNHFSNF